MGKESEGRKDGRKKQRCEDATCSEGEGEKQGKNRKERIVDKGTKYWNSGERSTRNSDNKRRITQQGRERGNWKEKKKDYVR